MLPKLAPISFISAGSLFKFHSSLPLLQKSVAVIVCIRIYRILGWARLVVGIKKSLPRRICEEIAFFC